MISFPKRRGWAKIDVFTLLNSVLFVLMCVFVYYDRFITFKGKANVHEFFFYAAVIFAGALSTVVAHRFSFLLQNRAPKEVALGLEGQN